MASSRHADLADGPGARSRSAAPGGRALRCGRHEAAPHVRHRDAPTPRQGRQPALDPAHHFLPWTSLARTGGPSTAEPSGPAAAVSLLRPRPGRSARGGSPASPGRHPPEHAGGHRDPRRLADRCPPSSGHPRGGWPTRRCRSAGGRFRAVLQVFAQIDSRPGCSSSTNVIGPQRTTRANHAWLALVEEKLSGGVLLSHTVSRAVPSALRGLASGFGMEPGVSLSLWPPKLYGDVAVPLPHLWPGGQGRAPDRISGTAQWTRMPSDQVGVSSSLWSSPRPISTGQLHLLPGFHFRPINPMVSSGALPG